MRIKDLTEQELFEQPQLIPPEEFGLDDASKNAKLAVRLLRKKNIEVLWTTQSHIMARTGRGQTGYYFLYNRTSKKIEYLVNYDTQKYNFIGHYVTQVAIWRDLASPATRDLSTKIFFDYILPLRGIVVSDRQQTHAGMRFWLLRMDDALKLGNRVGVIDIHQGKIDWCPEGDFQNWIPEQMKHWTIEKRSADFRFLIAKPGVIEINLGQDGASE